VTDSESTTWQFMQVSESESESVRLAGNVTVVTVIFKLNPGPA
jgi:hypothetical protein